MENVKETEKATQTVTQCRVDPGRNVLQHVPLAARTSASASHQSPMENILGAFDSWTKKAETLASNVWHNLNTAPNKPGAAWGKLTLTAKAKPRAIRVPYTSTFTMTPQERLEEKFAVAILSSTTGPVAGTLYLSTINLAFCSDRPLSFTAPSGQEAWSYYKVVIPLAKIGTVGPVAVSEKERYIQVVTVDGHEFWFMGFVELR
ncbi:LOW QUALITY PROTEIN: GEM-like protein 5 [Asparagus officinalis]|uniref:LOW QUALITY PROTEIN: GEM-like protein 5 n=1 Tax=Asparagus officinalis TaxID=4686 RepID=UPI00098DEC6B|nr:LOW QUALITY PROTEIN: GEM-like protein 5 [Asparagus officinalis]